MQLQVGDGVWFEGIPGEVIKIANTGDEYGTKRSVLLLLEDGSAKWNRVVEANRATPRRG